MTIDEAIHHLKDIKDEYKYFPDDKKALSMAIEALEKQIPKKPILDTGTGARRCISCNHIVSGFYCWNCGQHLSWEGKE